MRIIQWDYIILFWLLLTLLASGLLFLLPLMGWGGSAEEWLFRLVIFDWLVLNLLLLTRIRTFRLSGRWVHLALFGIALFFQAILAWQLYFSNEKGKDPDDFSYLGIVFALAIGGLFLNAIWMAVRVFGHPRFMKRSDLS